MSLLHKMIPLANVLRCAWGLSEPADYRLYMVCQLTPTWVNINIQDRDVVERSANLGKLEHVLQRERDQSVLYLSSISPQIKIYLMNCYLETDNVLETVPWPDNLDTQGRPQYATKGSFQVCRSIHVRWYNICTYIYMQYNQKVFLHDRCPSIAASWSLGRQDPAWEKGPWSEVVLASEKVFT